jgi:diaminopimelate decarboxylase
MSELDKHGTSVIGRPFLDHAKAEEIAELWGTPAYVYDLETLRRQVERALAFPAPFGLTVRYAMKAAPNATLLRFFHKCGLHFDASSGYEVHRLLAAGIPADKISLSSQELPEDFADMRRAGVHLHACSMRQLEAIGQAFPGGEVGLRFNPGAGSGGNNRTNVGGPSSSFGIWYEWLPSVKALLERFGLNATKIHTHIGSGSDPAVWQKVAAMSLTLVEEFPTVRILNLGGGFKVARVEGEIGTDLQEVGIPVAELLQSFTQRSGRQIHLEIEPGTFLVANAGAVLARVQDAVSTGPQGFEFLKLDTGMTEVLRPSLYGSQHPIHLLTARLQPGAPRPTIIVGHCCESGDILTPAPGEPELLAPRSLPPAEVGDYCLIAGAGAYCAGMATKNYNSFPEAPEVLLDEHRHPHLIRQRQSPAQIWQNEISPDSPLF